MTGAHVYLKCENLQRTGSFKVRGAFAKLRALKEDRVCAASMGNHAQGVAFAAHALGKHARIYMPSGTSVAKEQAVRAYGGEIVIRGRTLSEAIAAMREEGGGAFIHPYDDPEIIAGQGTIALEIADDLPGVDDVIVPIGGGGLIAGIAAGMSELSPEARVIGVQSEAATSAHDSFLREEVVVREPSRSIADGIAVGRVGDLPLAIMKEHVAEIGLVGENSIAGAVVLLLERTRLVVEGAGAAPLAFLLGEAELFRGRRVVLVLSGGNIDLTLIDRVAHAGLLEHGRAGRIALVVPDEPGGLDAATSVIARMRANILSISHERYIPALPFGSAHVVIAVETSGPEHLEALRVELRRAGIGLAP
jgi:threonine dehydratase